MDPFSVEGIEGRQYECNLKPCDQTCTSLHTFKQHLERIHPTKFNVGIENIRQGRPIDFTGIKVCYNHKIKIGKTIYPFPCSS